MLLYLRVGYEVCWLKLLALTESKQSAPNPATLTTTMDICTKRRTDVDAVPRFITTTVLPRAGQTCVVFCCAHPVPRPETSSRRGQFSTSKNPTGCFACYECPWLLVSGWLVLGGAALARRAGSSCSTPFSLDEQAGRLAVGQGFCCRVVSG